MGKRDLSHVTVITRVALVDCYSGVVTLNSNRDCRVYYVACPEERHHFILLDPKAPCYEKRPPSTPMKTDCVGCGKHHRVTVTTTWKIGYVATDEQRQGVAYSEPNAEPNP